MTRYDPLRELVLSRLREFFREPEAIFWVYVFPVILAIGLGIAFRSQPEPVVRAAVEAGARATEIVADLPEARGFLCEILPPWEARARLASGRVDIVIRPARPGLVYLFDPTRPEGRLARQKVDAALQRAAGREDAFAVTDQTLEEPGSRYIDFLFPGLIGMNLMGGGLYGVGFIVVDMRVRKLLKRFLATPMRRSHFLVAIMTSRLVFLIPEMVFLMSIATLGFGVPVRGGFIALVVIILTGALAFSGLGLLIATRARKLETISGLMNLFMLPMWLLSGIFFSTERFPEAMQPFIQALPLTAVNDALRAVQLDGASLLSRAVAHELLILAAWGGISFLLSLRLFRWT